MSKPNPKGRFSIDFEKMISGQATFKDIIREEAAKHLTKVSWANTAAGRFIARGQVKKHFNNLAGDVLRGKYDADIDSLSTKVTALTRDEIKNIVEEKLNISSDPAKALAQAKKMEQYTKDITEDEYVRVAQSLHAILPRRIRAIYDAIVCQDGESVESRMRAFYRMTNEEKVQSQLDMAARLPVDDIVDAVYETTQKATPARLKYGLREAIDALPAKDIIAMAIDALGVLEDLLGSVAKKNVIDVQDRKKAAQLGEGLRRVLETLEDKVVAAGVVPDRDLGAVLKKAFDTAANDNRPNHAAPGNIPGPKPEKNKGPKAG